MNLTIAFQLYVGGMMPQVYLSSAQLNTAHLSESWTQQKSPTSVGASVGML